MQTGPSATSSISESVGARVALRPSASLAWAWGGMAHDSLSKDVRRKVALPEPASKEADSLPLGPRLMSIASIDAARRPVQALDADQLLPLASATFK